jgi:uncharacterized delta-60 repeat protein
MILFHARLRGDIPSSALTARTLLATAAACLLFVSITDAQPGSVDFSFNAGSSVDFEIFQAALQSNGKVIIGGAFGSPSPGLARLNADGSPDRSFNAGTGVNAAFGYAVGLSPVYALAVQPDDKIIIGGVFSAYNGILRPNIARMNADGTLDPSFDPGQGSGGAIPNVLAVCLQSDGKILIGGLFNYLNGTNRNGIARLNADGSLDDSFNPGSGATGGTLNYNGVYCLAVQPDGKVLLGGEFASINGTNLNRIARLNSDGSVDPSFNPGVGANNTVLSIAVQTNDHTIWIGGSFGTVNGTNRNRIARLNADGSLETIFAPATGANSTVNAIAPLSNGQVLIGGNFTLFNSTARNRIARLNTDGSLDTNFNPGTGANGIVNDLALLSNGEVLAAGNFITVNGTPRNFIARLDTQGALDSGFNPGGTLDAVVNSMARQPDGKLIIGGTFTNINQISRRHVARLNADGSLDGSFDPGSGVDSGNAIVNAVALQSDGKVLLAGTFTSVDGVARNGLARLNDNGGLDSGYNPMPSSANVIGLAVQPDDKVLIGGSFTKVNGTNRANIARLNTDGTLDTTFNPGTGANSGVRSILVRTNGSLIIGGSFTLYNGTNRNSIAGLNADGSLDPTFNVGTGVFSGSPTLVDTLALQSDGKVLVGGNFGTYNGVGAESLVLLNTDGTRDTNFDTRTLSGGGFYTYSVASQPDGKVLIGGNFITIKSTGRNGIARLNTNGTLDTSFDPGTGAVAPLNPAVHSLVLQPDGQVVIAGGFTTVNRYGQWYVARLYGDAPVFNSLSTASGNFGLHWTAIPGRTYRLQYRTDLGSTEWSDLLPDVVALTNTASKTDPMTNSQRFYRAFLLPN